MPLNFGILSTANIARKVGRGIIDSKSCHLAAVSSRSLTRAQTYADEVGIPKAYGSHKELLEDDSIDCVYIPLPTGVRLQYVLDAISHKKHVLMEKPACVNAEALDRIEKLAKEQGVLVMDATQWLHHSRSADLQSAVANDIGDLRSVYSSFTFLMDDFSDIRASADTEPLGCLGDLGWYCIGWTLYMFNFELPTSVSAVSLSSINGVSATMNTRLTFTNNRSASFMCSFEMNSAQVGVVYGSKGTITVDDFVLPTGSSQHEFGDVPFDDKATFTIQSGGVTKETKTATPCLQQVRMIEEFGRIVEKKKAGGACDDEVSLWRKRTAHTQRVMDACHLSSTLGGKECEVKP